MPSIAIVDDDPLCREEIASLIHAHMEARGEERRVAAFGDAESFLAEAAVQRFDIAILDIIMPGTSGMDAALELYERNHGCRIIFLTVSPDYAIHGYRVNALDYLLKPVDPQALGRALDKRLDRAETPPAFTIILREGREARKVAVADILYCRSEGNYVRVHGLDWFLRCRSRLEEFKARLPGHFIRTHNRHLVNLDRVVAMTPAAMRLDNGEEVPISRAFKDSASVAYFRHVAAEAHGL